MLKKKQKKKNYFLVWKIKVEIDSFYFTGAGLETPDMIELRKRRIEADMEGGETPSLPYTVIPERQNARVGASMMGSTHTYDIKVI